MFVVTIEKGGIVYELLVPAQSRLDAIGVVVSTAQTHDTADLRTKIVKVRQQDSVLDSHNRA